MNSRSEPNEEDDHTSQSIGNGMPISKKISPSVYHGGSSVQDTPTKSTHHGGISGDPTKPAICVQSNVSGNSDRPITLPNSWLTTALLGAIHIGKANTLKNWARKPGTK